MLVWLKFDLVILYLGNIFLIGFVFYVSLHFNFLSNFQKCSIMY